VKFLGATLNGFRPERVDSNKSVAHAKERELIRPKYAARLSPEQIAGADFDTPNTHGVCRTMGELLAGSDSYRSGGAKS
jgi:hypothetical protein